MEEKNKNENPSLTSDRSWSAVSLAWQLGYSVAVPLVALALLGRFLDKKLETSPWLLLTGILLSIFMSSYLVYKKTLDIINKE
jgi:F0F1-type ATP synthase assembly protein I